MAGIGWFGIGGELIEELGECCGPGRGPVVGKGKVLVLAGGAGDGCVDGTVGSPGRLRGLTMSIGR